MNLEERMNGIAGAYCTDRNSKKEVDVDLLEDIKVIAVRIANEYAEECCRKQREICADQALSKSLEIECYIDNLQLNAIKESPLATEVE